LRILVTSDFHGRSDAIEKTILKARITYSNLIIICGDITHFGSIKDAYAMLSDLSRQQIPVLFVPGNCDPSQLHYEKENTVFTIHGRCLNIKGINFLGVGGSPPTPFITPFELAEEDIASILVNASEECGNARRLVLVSHSPPRNTRADLTLQGEHVGSESIREFIVRKKPCLVVCGHIHEGRGIDEIDGTIVVNPGAAKDGHVAVIDLNGNLNVELCQL